MSSVTLMTLKVLFFFIIIFFIYNSNAILKVPYTLPRPAPQPTHSHFLALAFPCTGLLLHKQLETRAQGLLVSSYCCSSYKVADPFSSFGTFSSSSIGGPLFDPIDDCEHLLLHLPGTGIASHETAMSGSFQKHAMLLRLGK